jgi:hypothetical protein
VLGQPITGWTQVGGTFTTNAFLNVRAIGDNYAVRRRPKHTLQAVQEFINQVVREIGRLTWVSIESINDLGDATDYYCMLLFNIG